MSTKRVNAFLQLEELNLAEYYGIKSPHHTSARDRLSGSGAPEATPVGAESRDRAVNVSERSYHYFSPMGSVSGAALSCAVSIHGGSFTWKENAGSDPHPASAGNEGGTKENDGSNVDPHSASTGNEGPTAAAGEGSEENTSIPWGLKNINISIKPVSCEHIIRMSI